MKLKIYIAFFFLIACFLTGGLYIGASIDEVTDRLETIITLHKVEFLRENLLNKIVVVQADLLLKDTPHARKVDIFVKHVEEMHQGATHCISCHHEEPVKMSIDHFEKRIDQYMKLLSRIYTLRANAARLKKEKQNAFDFGQATLEEINRIVITSAHKTSQRISQARNNIQKTRTFLYALMVIGPLIIIFATFYFFRQFSRSVFTLTTATRKIKDGNLSYRIKSQLKDEFHELAMSFNEMAISLKAQQLKIQRTEGLAAVGEVAAGLAHEVKNPLAGIKVSIEVLKNELPLVQEDKEIFLRIINEINRIEALLKNLLNYARPLKPQLDSVNLHEMLDALIKTSEFSLRTPNAESHIAKDISFVKDFDPEMVKISADAAQLQQVFLNLVLNGIDSIKEKGTITIKTAKIADGSVQIQISDTGKGIDPQALEMIFHPFFTTKPKGNGLGLAICKRLVEQHNGTIDAFNNPESGATFVITLPENQGSEE